MKPNMKKRIQWAVIFVSGFAMMGCGGKTASQNHPPVADAGINQTVDIHTRVYLEGNGSMDSDGDTLTYEWRLSQTPDGSGVLLQDRTQTRTSFTPDKAGQYIATLRVTDEHNASSEANVTVTARDVLVFPFSDPQHGIEPWTTNGLSSSATRMLKDINSQPAPVYLLTRMVEMGGKHYFIGSDMVAQKGLWVTDGTRSGTRLLKALEPSKWRSIATAGNYIFFSANDASHGTELWISDGTEPGTHLLKDINQGSDNSSPRKFVAFNSKIYFVADDGNNGRELWVSDGTAGGTQMLKDINSGGDANPNWLTICNNTLFFSASDGTTGIELWKSNGNVGNAVQVMDIENGLQSSNPLELVCMNTTLYFSAYKNSLGRELWGSGGTTTTTKLIKDIYSGAPSAKPEKITVCNNTLFFAAKDGATGKELWKSNGHVNNGVLVKDIRTGIGNGKIDNLYCQNGTLYFSADDGTNGSELWISDGTMFGTTMVKDIHQGSEGTDIWMPLVPLGGSTLYFAAEDGTRGMELWRSEGTEATTALVADLTAGSAHTLPFVMGAQGANLYIGTMQDYVYLGEAVQLQMYDTVNNTFSTVLPEAPPTANSFAVSDKHRPLIAAGSDGRSWMVVSDGMHGYEPWVSDRTSAGTVIIKDLVSGNGNSDIREMIAMNGRLFFVAKSTDDHEAQLYVTDGTSGGTVSLKTFHHDLRNMIRSGNTLYFSANDGIHGRELWRSDGTVSGTQMVADGCSGGCSSDPEALTVFKGQVYYAARDSSGDKELWRSDGTSVERVKNLWNSGSSSPRELTVCNDQIYFSAFGTDGKELWKSDGTDTGTMQVADIRSGAGGSIPQKLMCAGTQIYFSADDGSN